MHPSSHQILHLTGTRCGDRREIRWGSATAALTPKCFKFLSKLAVAARVQPGRWVTRDELERGFNQARYLHRLKGELESHLGELPPLWENNRKGAYRLTLPPERIEISWDHLERFDDWDLVSWVKDLRVLAGKEERFRVGTQPDRQAAA